MINTVLVILIFGLFYVVLQKVGIIYNQSKCIEPKRVYDYVEGKINKNSPEHDRIIAHLGICEKCRQLVDDFFTGKTLEDHLIDEE